MFFHVHVNCSLSGLLIRFCWLRSFLGLPLSSLLVWLLRPALRTRPKLCAAASVTESLNMPTWIPHPQIPSGCTENSFRGGSWKPCRQRPQPNVNRVHSKHSPINKTLLRFRSGAPADLCRSQVESWGTSCKDSKNSPTTGWKSVLAIYSWYLPSTVLVLAPSSLEWWHYVCQDSVFGASNQ